MKNRKIVDGNRHETPLARLCDSKLAALVAHHESLVGTIIGPTAWSDQRSRARAGVTLGLHGCRERMSLLEQAGELGRIAAEVELDREIGTVASIAIAASSSTEGGRGATDAECLHATRLAWAYSHGLA
jgi:hypothetical protein